MNGLISLLAFIVTLGILVTVHEYGHYWVARRCGIKVLTFSIGFGKKLLSWQRGDTTWQLAAIPLGGYVRMLDEREAPVDDADLSRSFNQQHPLKKMAVAVAGPAANLILALLFYWILFLSGVSTLKPVVADVVSGSPAQLAGIRAGDRIDSVAGEPVASWDDLLGQMIDASSSGVPFDMVLRGASGDATVRVDPVKASISNVDADLLDRFGISPLPIIPVVSQVEPGSAAAQAGIRAGDKLSLINGKPLDSWTTLQQTLIKHPDQPLQLTVIRAGAPLVMTLTPHVLELKGKRIGRVGLAPTLDPQRWDAQQMQLRYGPLDAMAASWSKAWGTVGFTLRMFGRMLTGQVSTSQIGGPVTLATVAGRSAQMGLEPFISTLALISLSLAVLNLLPVPLLDGGHLMYHTAELVTGRPVPERVQAFGMRLGLAFLAGLMALALYNDFFRLISG